MLKNVHSFHSRLRLDSKHGIMKYYEGVLYIINLKFVSDEGDDQASFYIITDNVIVTEAVHSLIECIKLCIMIYFVYYIKYPSCLSKTLEFIQMYIFKLLPEESRVTTARKVSTQQKAVVALINKISNVKVSDDEQNSNSENEDVAQSGITTLSENVSFSIKKTIIVFLE